MSVRLAGPQDVHALAAVHLAAWRAAYRGIIPDGVLQRFSFEAFELDWRISLADAQRLNLVSESQGQLWGMAAAGPGRDGDLDPSRTAELYAIYVHPDRWRCGVGKALWEAACRWLQAQGFQDVVVWVLAANERARGFYVHVGFTLEHGRTRTVERHAILLPEVRYRWQSFRSKGE